MTIFKQKYAELLKMGKDAARETMAPLRANEMRTKAIAKQSELDSRIAEAEQRVLELACAYPIDFDKVLEAMDRSALLRRQKEQLQVLIDELLSAPATTAAPASQG